MQKYTIYLYFQTALHVSGGLSNHHHITVSTAVRVSIMPDTVDTVLWAPDDGCRYYPKHVEQFAGINKLYIVAACWIIFDTYYTMHGPLKIKFKTFWLFFWTSVSLKGMKCLKSVNKFFFFQVGDSNPLYELTNTTKVLPHNFRPVSRSEAHNAYP